MKWAASDFISLQLTLKVFKWWWFFSALHMLIHPNDCNLLCETFSDSSKGLFLKAEDIWSDAPDVILFEIKFIIFKEMIDCNDFAIVIIPWLLKLFCEIFIFYHFFFASEH